MDQVLHLKALGGLYKRPIKKRTGDLQWRIVHGKIATNRHRAPRSRDMGGVFCGECETLKHLCVGCSRLTGLVSVVIK